MNDVFLQCTGEDRFIVSRCANMLFWDQELKTCTIEKPVIKRGACLELPCKNDGICEDLDMTNFKCVCPAGFTGALCEEPIDFCSDLPCLNEGRCVSHSTGYNCVCKNKVVDHSCATRKSITIINIILYRKK